MSTTTARVLIAIGAAGVAFYVIRERAQKKSLMERTRDRAESLAGSVMHRASDFRDDLKDRAVKVSGSARTQAKLQKKGLLEAVQAGIAAYQRVTA